MEFRYIVMLSLWTLLIGPVMQSGPPKAKAPVTHARSEYRADQDAPRP